MASLLPLLQDLLPMIMPSEVRVTRDHELVPVPERAERPPWYQRVARARRPAGKPQTTVQQTTQLGVRQDVVDEEQKSVLSESDSGNAEPILLFDHEGRGAATAAPAVRPDTLPDSIDPSDVSKDGSAPGQRLIDGPAVFRKDAMVGVSDTMCATGK